MRFEIRANLDGMTLSGLDKLSRDEARIRAGPAHTRAGIEGSADRYHTVRRRRTVYRCRHLSGNPESEDATLSGLLWPLGESVKLDSTIDRRTLRAQISRLGTPGYALDFKSQEWKRQLEQQAA